jgi:hypothetical protein
LAELHVRHRGSGRGIGEVRGPEEGERLDLLLWRRRAGRVLLVQHLSALAGSFGDTCEHLGSERFGPSVADRTQRIDGQHAGQPIRDGGCGVKHEMASP